MTPGTLPISTLFGIPFFAGTQASLIAYLQKHCATQQKLLVVCTPNPEQLVQAQQDKPLSAALRAADICIPDGIGIVYASRLASLIGKKDHSLAERVTGVDVVQGLIQEKLTIYVIGGRGYSTHRVTTEKNYPLFELDLPGESTPAQVFWTEGYSDITAPTQEEDKMVLDMLSLVKPDVVCVALGAPHQELWLMKHRAFLEKRGVRVALCVGGAFDFIVQKVPRAPLQVQQLGMEWLFRLWQEPWRWRRQTRLLQFIQMTIRELVS